MSFLKPAKDDLLAVFRHGMAVGREEEQDRIVALFTDKKTSVTESMDYFIDSYYGTEGLIADIVNAIRGN